MDIYKYILLGWVLLNTVPLKTQNQIKVLGSIKTEVSEINNQQLYKNIFGVSSSNGFNCLKITDYESVDGSLSYVYFDRNKKIRKFVNLSSYPEGNSYAIHYFDKVGSVIYTIYYETSAMEIALVGSRYLSEGRLVYTNIQLNNEENNSNVVKDYYGGKIIGTGKRVYDIVNVKDLENYLKLIYNDKEIIPNEDCIKVKFSRPSHQDITIVNARRVNIRQEPSRSSNILSVVGLGTNYHIVQMIDEIKVGDEFWSKIHYKENETGYILSDYLEPLEIIIE